MKSQINPPPSTCQNYLQKILCVSVEMIYFHFENEINSCQNLVPPHPQNEKITNQKMSRVFFKLIIVYKYLHVSFAPSQPLSY